MPWSVPWLCVCLFACVSLRAVGLQEDHKDGARRVRTQAALPTFSRGSTRARKSSHFPLRPHPAAPQMFTKDLVLNASWYDKHKKHHTHPCFIGTMAEVLKDGCGQCPPVPADVDPTTLEYVPWLHVPRVWFTNLCCSSSASAVASHHSCVL